MVKSVAMKLISESHKNTNNHRMVFHCQCGREFVYKTNSSKNVFKSSNGVNHPQCPQCHNIWVGDQNVQASEKREKKGQQYFRLCMRHDDHFHAVHVGRANSWRDFFAKVMLLIPEDSIPGLLIEPISRESYKQYKSQFQQIHEQTMQSMGHAFMGPHLQPQDLSQEQAFHQDVQPQSDAAKMFQQAMEEQNHPHGLIPMVYMSGNMPPDIMGLLGSMMKQAMSQPPNKSKKKKNRK